MVSNHSDNIKVSHIIESYTDFPDGQLIAQ